MNLASALTAAERLAAIDRAALRLEPARCLRTQWRPGEPAGDCTRCVVVCPTGALALPAPVSADPAGGMGMAPVLAETQCTACLACLPACPVGALAADDAVPALLECATRTEVAEAPVVELLCARHPRPELGLSADALGLRLRGCLAGLGAGAYVALAALGVRRIVARTEACSGCAWGALQPAINAQLHLAGRLLAGRGLDNAAVSACGPAAPGAARPLWEADNPPMSRRDVFRRLSRQGQVAAARAWAAGEAETTGQRGSGRDRRRMIKALAALPEAKAEPGAGVILDGGGFAYLSVSDACTACGVCARVCPTQALRFEQIVGVEDKARFALRLAPAECIGCGACQAMCAPAAISLVAAPSVAQVFGAAEPVTLAAGPLVRCHRCRAFMAERPGQRLCPVCAGRTSKLSSPHMPPAVRAILEKRGLRP